MVVGGGECPKGILLAKAFVARAGHELYGTQAEDAKSRNDKYSTGGRMRKQASAPLDLSNHRGEISFRLVC